VFLPAPADGARDISSTVNLSWVSGSLADSYDLYFGTDSTPDAGEFVEEVETNGWEPGDLEPGTTYYWRVDAVNDCEVTRGSVWSFTTRAADPVAPRSTPIAAPCGAGACGASGASMVSLTLIGLVGLRRRYRRGRSLVSWRR
jgi:hypothetical protein